MNDELMPEERNLGEYLLDAIAESAERGSRTTTRFIAEYRAAISEAERALERMSPEVAGESQPENKSPIVALLTTHNSQGLYTYFEGPINLMGKLVCEDYTHAEASTALNEALSDLADNATEDKQEN